MSAMAQRLGAVRGAGKKVMFGLVCLALVACNPIIRNHGYVPVDEDMALLEVGVDTKETAAPKVGRPSANGLLNDDAWYYVQSRWEARGPREPVEIDRKVVVLSFSESGTLQNVEKFGIEKGQVVPLSRRITETNVRRQSVLKTLFANFGRLGAAQLLP